MSSIIKTSQSRGDLSPNHQHFAQEPNATTTKKIQELSLFTSVVDANRVEPSDKKPLGIAARRADSLILKKPSSKQSPTSQTHPPRTPSPLVKNKNPS